MFFRPSLVLLAICVSGIAPALGATVVEFYEYSNCTKSIGQVNGTGNGACHAAIATDASARLISLDPHCSATIYSDPFCSNVATGAASLGDCISDNVPAGSFNVVCQAPASSPTMNPQQSSIMSDPNSGAQGAGSFSTSMVIAISVTGCVIFLALVAIVWLFWRSYRRRQQRQVLESGRQPSTKDEETPSQRVVEQASRPAGSIGPRPSKHKLVHPSPDATARASAKRQTKPASRKPLDFLPHRLTIKPSNISVRARESNAPVSPLTPGITYDRMSETRVSSPPSPVTEAPLSASTTKRVVSGFAARRQSLRTGLQSPVRRPPALSLFPAKSAYKRVP